MTNVKQYGCRSCWVKFSSPSGRCPTCGAKGSSDLSSWVGTRPPGTAPVWVAGSSAPDSKAGAVASDDQAARRSAAARKAVETRRRRQANEKVVV